MQKCTNCQESFSLRGLKAHEASCYSEPTSSASKTVKISQWKWAFNTWLKFELAILNFFLPELTVSGIVIGLITVPIWCYITYYRYFYIINVVYQLGLFAEGTFVLAKSILTGQMLEGGNVGYISSVFMQKYEQAKAASASATPPGPNDPHWVVKLVTDGSAALLSSIMRPGVGG